MKQLVLALAALSLVGGAASPSFAAPQCRDKNGKFIPCPAKPTVCRDAKGKFIPCPAAKPRMCRDSKGHFSKCR